MSETLLSPAAVRLTASETAVAALREWCQRPDAAVGMLLPSENQLAEQLGVSRPVVREALRTVEADGWITRRPGKRAVIAPLSTRQIDNFILKAVHSDKQRALELTDIRAGLELQACWATTERVHRSDTDMADGIATVERVLAESRVCKNKARDRAVLDMGFHHALASLSGNRTLVDLLRSIDDALFDSRIQNHAAAIAHGAPPGKWVDEHEEVLAAVLSGDTQRSIRTMRAHLDDTVTEIRSR